MRRFLFALLGATVVTGAALAEAAPAKPPDSNTPQKIADLVAQLKDPDPQVRSAAGEAIAREAALRSREGEPADPLGEPFTSAVGPLIAALKDGDAGVRCNAVFALGHIGDPRAAEPLIGRLKDRDPRVRRGAAGALGRLALGGGRLRGAVGPLAAAMKDPEASVADSAAMSLGMMGTRGARRVLLEALKRPSPDVRERALWGLAWTARLGTRKGRVEKALLAALEDPEPSVRRTAAGRLAWLGDRRAVRPLLAMMEAKDEQVRDSAMESLVRLLADAPTGGPAKAAPWSQIVRRMSHKVERLDVTGRPLDEVLSSIARKAQVNLYPQWRRLKPLGVTPKQKVTANLADVTLGAALWHVLASVDPSDRIHCRVHDGILVVSAEADREASRPSNGDAGRGRKTPGRETQAADTPEDGEVAKKLKERVHLDFEKTTIRDVLRFLGEVIGVRVVPDWPALKKAGCRPSALVTVKMPHGVPAGRAIRLVLDNAYGPEKAAFSVKQGHVEVKPTAAP